MHMSGKCVCESHRLTSGVSPVCSDLLIEVRVSHLNQEFIDKVGLHRDLVLHVFSLPVTRITGKP